MFPFILIILEPRIMLFTVIQTTLPKPKQIVQNVIKYVSSIFPTSNFVNLIHAASKDKKVKRSFKRLNQVEWSSCKLFGQCANIDTTRMSHHGYHSYSYQRYTGNLDKLEKFKQTSSSGINRRSLTAANKWNDGVIFNKNGIFCSKLNRKKVWVQCVWKMEEISYFEFWGVGNIQEVVIKNISLTYSANKLCTTSVVAKLF